MVIMVTHFSSGSRLSRSVYRDTSSKKPPKLASSAFFQIALYRGLQLLNVFNPGAVLYGVLGLQGGNIAGGGHHLVIKLQQIQFLRLPPQRLDQIGERRQFCRMLDQRGIVPGMQDHLIERLPRLPATSSASSTVLAPMPRVGVLMIRLRRRSSAGLWMTQR